MSLPALAIKNDSWPDTTVPSPQSKTPLRIILMDDNDFDRKHIRRIANRSKHELTLIETRSIEETKRLLTFQTADIVLADCRMPDGDGIAFVRDLRKCPAAGTPAFIVITGDDDSRTAIRALRSGAADYLPKEEITPDLFDSAITNALKISGTGAPVVNDTPTNTKQVTGNGPSQPKLIANLQALKGEILPLLAASWHLAKERPTWATDGAQANHQIAELLGSVSASLDDMLIEAMCGADIHSPVEVINPRVVIEELLSKHPSVLPNPQAGVTIRSLPRLQARRAEFTLLFELLLSASVDACALGQTPKIVLGAGADNDGNTIIWLRDNGLPLSVRQQTLGRSLSISRNQANDRRSNPYAWSIAQRIVERCGGALKLSEEQDEVVVMLRFPREMVL